MMKKFSLILMLAALVLGAAAQDLNENVELKVNNSVPVDVGMQDVVNISLRANRYGNDIEVSGLLENHSDKYSLLLFGHSISEKELKREKIRFDKKSYGKTDRKIITTDGIEDVIREIGIGKTGRMEVGRVSNDNSKLSIWIYLAEQKRKKRIIKRRIEVVLHVTIKDTDKPNGDYDGIKSRCDSIIEEIDHVTICPSRNHSLSMDEQKAPYLEKIAAIKDEIGEIKEKNHWRDSDREFERYKEIISRLDAIVFHEERCQNCGISHPNSPHRCQYCDNTPQSILQQLISIYQKLDTDQISKSEAKRRAAQVYTPTKNCPNLKRKMTSDSSTSNKVERYYDSIINY